MLKRKILVSSAANPNVGLSIEDLPTLRNVLVKGNNSLLYHQRVGPTYGPCHIAKLSKNKFVTNCKSRSFN